MKVRAASSSAAVLCVAGCLLACGGGASSSNTAGSNSSFVASANRVCATFYAKAYSLPPPVGVQQLNAYPKRQQAIREQELTALRGLAPPASRAASYRRFLAKISTINGLYGRAVARLDELQAASVRALIERASKLEAALRVEAQAIGLGRCARNPYSATHRVSSQGFSKP